NEGAPATGAGAAAAKQQPEEKTADKEKTPPPPDPKRVLLGRLVKEWEEHQGLWKADPPPYRAAPGHWRRDQSALLRADRWVRFAWHDDDALDEAGALLGEAVKARDDLNKALKDEADREKAFPFRPVSGSSSDEGARMLNDALRWLTDKGDPA